VNCGSFVDWYLCRKARRETREAVETERGFPLLYKSPDALRFLYLPATVAFCGLARRAERFEQIVSAAEIELLAHYHTSAATSEKVSRDEVLWREKYLKSNNLECSPDVSSHRDNRPALTDDRPSFLPSTN